MTEEAYGIIYKITNKINQKSYIGKTKSHYGKMKFGLKGRWRQHKVNAKIKSRENECVLFYNALKKYGEDNFIPEILLICDLDSYDNYEIDMIKLYDTTNREFGYNIASGGKGRSVVHVNSEIRNKIYESQKSTDDLVNIKKFERNGKLVGYRLKYRNRGIQYQKYFTSTKYTVEENFKKAQEYIENIKKGITDYNKYNRKYNLPKNISYHKENNINIGYKICIIKNKVTYSKTFCSKLLSMDEKYKLSIEWLDKIKKETSNAVKRRV
jgi:hypothetical protein